METFSCTFTVTAFCVLHFIHALYFTRFSLLSCPPARLPFPLPPCSTCLSELGRARYTHRRGGGPCLRSINNFWNLEIQVGPVSGRLYHTLEGGLTGTLDEIPICFWHSLWVFLQVWLFWVYYNGWSHLSRLLQLLPVSEPTGGPRGHPLWSQFLYGLHQRLLEWSWLHRDLHLSSV